MLPIGGASRTMTVICGNRYETVYFEAKILHKMKEVCGAPKDR